MKKKLTLVSLMIIAIIATFCVNLSLSSKNDSMSLLTSNIEALAASEEGDLYECYTYCVYDFDCECTVTNYLTHREFTCRIRRGK